MIMMNKSTVMLAQENSAHTPGCLKSLIFNQLAIYWDQKTKPKDYEYFANLLFQRLKNRGYSYNELYETFHIPSKYINELFEHYGEAIKPKVQKDTDTNGETNSNIILFYREFHPRDITGTKNQNAFKNSFNLDEVSKADKQIANMKIGRLIVAYSRHNNPKGQTTSNKNLQGTESQNLRHHQTIK